MKLTKNGLSNRGNREYFVSGGRTSHLVGIQKLLHYFCEGNWIVYHTLDLQFEALAFSAQQLSDAILKGLATIS